MLYTAVRLAERQGIPRDPESNALLESFIVHVRCLRDFLWGARSKKEPMDAFAFDFCEPGKWESQRAPEPPSLVEIAKRRRAGREVVHLTYHRLTIEEESKDWDCGEIYADLADELERFALLALPRGWTTRPERGCKTCPRTEVRLPVSVATGAAYGFAIRRGTIGFPGFQHGS